jgi:hypothetical protein
MLVPAGLERPEFMVRLSGCQRESGIYFGPGLGQRAFMKRLHGTFALLLLIALAGPACKEKSTAEKAEDALKSAASQTRGALEEAGDELKKVGEEIKDGTRQAYEETKAAVKEGVEKAKEAVDQ